MLGSGVAVAVGGGSVAVSVGTIGVPKVGKMVTSGSGGGVRGGTLGTQRACPTRIVVLEPRQLARCNWEVVMPKLEAIR